MIKTYITNWHNAVFDFQINYTIILYFTAH